MSPGAQIVSVVGASDAVFLSIEAVGDDLSVYVKY